MFVVRRPFKTLGRVYTAGSVITEPAAIKRFKGKLAEGKIVEVTEQTYDVAYKYFKEKFGVELPSLTGEHATEEPVEDKTEEPVEDKTEEPVEDKTEEPVEDKTEVKAKPAKAAAKASVVSKK